MSSPVSSVGRALRPQLEDVFAVQDEITQAVVAAIEPQLYAAENFRSQRKTPDNMDAWDLVMRALSHYWRVTRADNLVAQALLEKAIAVDPGLRPGAESVGGLPHLRGPYGLGGHRVSASGRRNAPPWRRSAPTPRMRGRIMRWPASICSTAAMTIALPSSSWRCGSIRISPRRAGSMAWRWPIAGAGRKAMPPQGRRCAFRPRDPFAGIYSGVAAYSQYVGGNYEEAAPRPRALRQRPGFNGAHRVLTASLGMSGHPQAAAAALASLREAQPNISLAWLASEMPFEHEAEGRIISRGSGRQGWGRGRVTSTPPSAQSGRARSNRFAPSEGAMHLLPRGRFAAAR